MKYSLWFKLPGLPKPVNQQTSMHWAVKGKMVREWKRAVALTVGSRKPPKPLKRAYLELTRYSSTAPDYDGLTSSFKHVIDGLVECGVLEDDSMEHIGMPHFRWQKEKKGQGRIEVYVCDDEETDVNEQAS